MSFVDGFSKGYGLVDGTMRQNKAEERQASMDERALMADQENTRRYNQAQAMRQETFDMTKADRKTAQEKDSIAQAGLGFDPSGTVEKNQAIAAQQYKTAQSMALAKAEQENQKHRADIAKIQADIAKNYSGMNKDSMDMRNAQFEFNVKTQDLRNKVAGNAYLKLKNGYQISEQERSELNNSALGDLAKKSQNLQEMQQHFNQYESIQDPMELMNFINSPKSLDYLTTLSNNEIYAREQANPGKVYKIGGINLAGDNVVPLFDIYDKATGELLVSKAPATQNKSSNQDDQLSRLTIKDFKSGIVERMSVMADVQNDPALSAYFNKINPKDLMTVSSGSSVIDPTTGRVVAANVKPDVGKLDYYKLSNEAAKAASELHGDDQAKQLKIAERYRALAEGKEAPTENNGVTPEEFDAIKARYLQ